jgi:outer membrane protein TolC
MVERDWHARALLLRDTFTDALARVIEQQRLVIAERNELTLAKAQVEAGRTTTRDLVDAQQRVSNAILALYQANLDVLRSDLNLRLHENRLLSLLP